MRGEVQSNLTLSGARLRNGVYRAILTSDDPFASRPTIAATLNGQPLDDVSVERDQGIDGQWHLTLPMTTDILSDGVHTVVIEDTDAGRRLGSVSIVAGEPLEDDIRAEVALLRAELDMMKRAFRRHCLETMPEED